MQRNSDSHHSNNYCTLILSFFRRNNIDLLRSIPSILCTVIMSDSSSVTSRPTESELDVELAELVNWQRFATHLPDLTRGDIEEIELDNRDVQRQKLELYGTWLRRCPNASWNDIVLALEKSKEITLANVIKMKFNAVISSDSFISRDKQAYDQVQPSFNQEVYLLSEEKVVEELQKLHRSFTSLARDIHCKLDELVKSQKSSLHHITTYVQEAQVGGMKGLTEVNTIDDLFSAIRPHNDYLDCELLEMIVEEYLDDDDITKVKAHIDKVKHFKRTAPIKTLKNKLQQYTSIPNISEMHLIVTIKLQADWGRVTLESIEKLVQNLLQYRNIVRIFKVESGSISVMLLLPKEKLQHFIVSSSQKLQFMRLTGIFRLQIGAITVFEQKENKNFSFQSAFLESSQCGDDEAVQFLLDLGVNVSHSNSEGQTALILASKSGEEEVVQTLLSAGANINHKDKYGHTALMVSKTNKIFLLLLQPNPKISFFEHSTSTHLMIASDLGHVAVIETLLIEYNNDPNVQNKAGWSALMFASCNGHLQVVDLLLKQNADPNVQNLKGWTALILASGYGDPCLVEILLKKGADPNIHAIDGLTALIIASINGHLQIVALLLKACADPNSCSGQGWTALMFAIFKDNLQLAELLLKERADPNAYSNKGWTALMFASFAGCHQLVELLLKEKADPNVRSNTGWTALLLASKKGYSNVVVMLLQYKANPHIEIRKHLDSFTIATAEGNRDVVNAFLNHSEIRYESLSMGWYSACQLGHVPIITLLSKRVDIVSNQTDLLISCAEGDLGTVIDQLMSGKMTPDVQFIHGVTPLMISSSCGHTVTAEALIQSGANINKTEESGYTALDYAELANKDTTRVLLLQHGGLHGIDLDSRVRTLEESLHKTVDDMSAEKHISNVQSPHSSRRQRSLNISSIKTYLEESIDTYFSTHQSAGNEKNPLTIDLNDLNSD